LRYGWSLVFSAALKQIDYAGKICQVVQIGTQICHLYNQNCITVQTSGYSWVNIQWSGTIKTARSTIENLAEQLRSILYVFVRGGCNFALSDVAENWRNKE